MNRLPHAGNYRDLLVYQKSRVLARNIFELTMTFPDEERFALTDQIRRASRSIGAQIAESWAKRRYEKHFISKLTDADAEQYETQHWLEIALDCGYLAPEQSQKLVADCREIGRLLGGMLAKSHIFCRTNPNKIRESAGEYFIS